MLIRTTTFFGEKVGGLGSRWSPAGGVGLYGLLFESDRSRCSVVMGQGLERKGTTNANMGKDKNVQIGRCRMAGQVLGTGWAGRFWEGAGQGGFWERAGQAAACVRAGRSWRAD